MGFQWFQHLPWGQGERSGEVSADGEQHQDRCPAARRYLHPFSHLSSVLKHSFFHSLDILRACALCQTLC